MLLFCFLSSLFVVIRFRVSFRVESYCFVINSLTCFKSSVNLLSFSISNCFTLFSTPSVVSSANSLNFIPEKYFENLMKNNVEIPPMEKIKIMSRKIIDRLNALIRFTF